MKKIFAVAAIALMCVPAFVSCKKGNKGGETPSTKSVTIDGQEKTVVSAVCAEDPDEYLLTVAIEDNISFSFELDKANKGKRIDLLQPDPLASKALVVDGSSNFYFISVFKSDGSGLRFALANGDPDSVFLNPLGEGSYMQIDEKDGDIVLDFELRDCPYNDALGTDGLTIAGHVKGFEKYIRPPK